MKRKNFVKDLIFYNAIFIAAVICLSVVVIFGIESRNVRTSDKTNLQDATERVTTAAQSFVAQADEISKAIFLGADFQDSIGVYIEDIYDLAINARIQNMLQSYLRVSDILKAIVFVPCEDGDFTFTKAVNVGEYNLLHREPDIFVGYLDDVRNADLLIVDRPEEKELFFCRNAVDLRENSPTFFKTLGFGIVCIDKTKLAEELSIYTTAEDFYFEVNYNGKPVVSSFTEPLSDYRRKTELVATDDWSVVGYMAGNVFIRNMRSTLITVIVLGVGVLFVTVLISLLLNLYVTRSFRYLTENFEERTGGNGPMELEPTDDVKMNRVIDSYNRMIRERDALTLGILDEQRKNFDIMQEKNMFEVNALYSQINKHFLFNALATIRALVNDGERETAVSCIRELSIFLRYSLTPNDTVSLKQEFDALEAYLGIQRLRYGNVSFTIESDRELDAVQIPKMVLQPIVENAFSHGNVGEGDAVRICVRKRADGILIAVCDTGDGMTSEACRRTNADLRGNLTHISEKHNGLALHNVQQRLRLLVSEKCTIRIYSRPGRGTVVFVKLIKENAGV